MELEHLMDLYVDELKDTYNAEKQLLRALPKMAKKAEHPELRQAFENHATMTEEQVRRLETIFDDLGQSPTGKKCKGMEGLLEEDADPDVRDAALIGAAQRVEHYEIAGYGCVRTFADLLGYERQAQALQETLDEEGRTDHVLTDVAEERINPEARS